MNEFIYFLLITDLKLPSIETIPFEAILTSSIGLVSAKPTKDDTSLMH